MFRRLVFGVCVATAPLGGCAITDNFDDRVGRYDLAAAQSRDRMILTNVVRASKAEPLSFVQLGQLSGTTTSQATLGLPGFVIGPHAAAYPALNDAIFGGFPGSASGIVGNSANMQGSTNFQATPSETKDFYRGLLQEVEPRTLSLFIQQGVAREVLFYLFTDRIIEEKGGMRRELRNDPLDPEFPTFRHYVALAIGYGISSEPVGKPIRHAETGANPSGGAKTPPPPEIWRLCFNPLYMDKSLPKAGNAPICGAGGASQNERAVSFLSREGERVRLEVIPRSAFAIFQFLGRIMAAGDQGRIELVSREAIDQGPLSDPILFNVVEGGGGQGCFVSTFYEGVGYCVPQAGSANTKRVLGLLTQLIALNTAIDEVPVAPTVRVVP